MRERLPFRFATVGSWLGWLAVACLGACVPAHEGPPAGAAPSTKGATPADSTSSAAAAPALTADATAPVANPVADAAAPVAKSAPAPSPWRPNSEQAKRCAREHCYAGGAARCFEICHRYNHARRPKEHDRCDANCRKNYGLDDCDMACWYDVRAYGGSSEPAAGATAPPDSCVSGFKSCRRDCLRGRAAGTGRYHACELRCVRELRGCTPRPEDPGIEI